MRISPGSPPVVVPFQVNTTSTNNANLFFGPGTPGSIHTAEDIGKSWQVKKRIRITQLTVAVFTNTKDAVSPLFARYNPSRTVNPGIDTLALLSLAPGVTGAGTPLATSVIIEPNNWLYFHLDTGSSTLGQIGFIGSLTYELAEK